MKTYRVELWSDEKEVVEIKARDEYHLLTILDLDYPIHDVGDYEIIGGDDSLSLDNIYNMIITYKIASTETVDTITDINGWNEKTLNDIIYSKTGYRNIKQFEESEIIDKHEHLKLTNEEIKLFGGMKK